MNYKIKICLLLVVFGFSCSTTEKKTNGLKKIVLRKTSQIQPISGFVGSVDYVEFSFPEKPLIIGQIDDAKVLDNNIYIKQHVSRETGILRFSANGKFLNAVGTNGRGAGEIQNPRDLVVYQNNLAVWDQSEILIFSKTGNFISKLFDAHLPGNSFFCSQNNFYLFHETTAPGLLSKYSTEGDLQNVFHPYQNEFAGTGYSRVWEAAKDSFHLFSPINDTIYSFSSEKLIPQYEIVGKGNPTFIQLLKKAEKREPMELLKYINTNRHWVIHRYLENRNFIFVAYRLGSSSYNLLIRKENWETFYYETLINDIDGGVWSDPVYLSENDELYVPLNAYQITGHKIKNKKRHEFDEIQKETDMNDNPKIMICKLK